ncbi:sugar-binding transcriptional regulator [Lacisediminihabitans changchengi]|uniref:Sugar-binding transcriptional regulator n=1 Tax=Lacisediminihabitans changchengi TaxID=2787634 RepID=A0A934SNH0_9MICO|nr:sugar-binding domain-containing protein [Lacisediminihabitans changchengi]MBK4348778.1 sugar-binding transcriptional regulator [Lacisediminihabitans changchengi]
MVDALRAAQLYYLQDLTMEAIAHELRTSRSSVSRLLSHARATGLVEIHVTSPLDRSDQIARRLHDRFGITPHVVPVGSNTSDVDRLERVALSAARLLTRFIDSNMIIGVAWGSTVSAISRHLSMKETSNTQVVQLNGAGNTETTGIDYSSEILQRFGSAFGAKVQQFPVPAFFDRASTKEALWHERSTIRVLEMQRRMDVALFGLGTPFAEVPSRVYIGGYLDDADFSALSASNVVGDVATVFYRQDGTTDNIPMNDRASGPSFSVLRRASRRVCVVSGTSKIPALTGALAAGLITDLIIDEDTGRALLGYEPS